jgi:lon-related putative ATP-dependent protease
MATVEALGIEALCRRCDPGQFSFETTAELDDLEGVIGQERAVEAIRFGIGIQQQGYNLFAVGPNGTGKYTAVQRSLSQQAAGEPVPTDWCYVYDFEQPHMPNALPLPPGQGVTFAQDMKRLVEELFATIPSAFESEEYHNQKRVIEAEFKGKQEGALEGLRQEAAGQKIALIRTQDGLALAPVTDNEVIKPDDFMKLPQEERQIIEAQIEEFQVKLQKIIQQVPQWIRRGRSRIKELNEEVASFAIEPIFAEIREQYATLAGVSAYLHSVKGDVVQHHQLFLGGEEKQGQDGAGLERQAAISKETFARRYVVNLVVDHSKSAGAPIIYEQNPTYSNLIGRSEHQAKMGTLLTDFTMIKPGALHLANGGYLIVDCRKLLTQPYAWEGLKQAIRTNQIRIESPGQSYGLVSTVALEPQPIPLEVKIVLLGERSLYYLLYQNDPDFSELFKVTADFNDQMERTDLNNMAYAQLIGTLARKENLRHFNRAAVARVIEHSARLVGDSERVTTHMQSVADLLLEADYWAGETHEEIIGDPHVQQAIEAKTRRLNRVEERLKEGILRETVLIDSSGEKVGQVNGLSVLMMGNYAFGRPSRITARTRIGSGEVVDIERQVELGGPLHSKGVLILASYLGARYAADRPLSLSASLVFEQSYGGVDGDSASSAELYALLSSLANAPIKQSLAVTGSVNQHGQVQAIGGVNEKIEGFFDICKARGLRGDQGVLIPRANVKHLMLSQKVVEAVAKGQFNVYPIDTIEQGIELLTGIPAGEMDNEGFYPPGSINQRVVARLEELAETKRRFDRPDAESKEAVETTSVPDDKI